MAEKGRGSQRLGTAAAGPSGLSSLSQEDHCWRKSIPLMRWNSSPGEGTAGAVTGCNCGCGSFLLIAAESGSHLPNRPWNTGPLLSTQHLASIMLRRHSGQTAQRSREGCRASASATAIPHQECFLSPSACLPLPPASPPAHLSTAGELPQAGRQGQGSCRHVEQ